MPSYEYIYEIVKDADGVDCFIKRGDIVRCRECKQLDTHNHRCKVWNHGVYVWFDFCSRAERKE